MIEHRARGLALLLCATASLVPCRPAGAQPLARDLGRYFILAQRAAHVKNLHLNSACDVGVNCAQPTSSSECGRLFLDGGASGIDGSQFASDALYTHTSPVAPIDVWQLFTNQPFNGTGLSVRNPPVGTFTPALITGTTCGPDCTADPAFNALCGFPDPFPACGGGNVTAKQFQDCSGAPDAVPGNKRCDLPPGTYGDVVVRDDADIAFAPGTYNLCSFSAGKRTTVTGNGSVLNVMGAGRVAFAVNNNAVFGEKCGDLTVRVADDGDVRFGKHGHVAAQVCAPRSDMNLGGDNFLVGQFVALEVDMDPDNKGECCGGACTCIDAFTPDHAAVGDPVTLSSACDLLTATAVRICGLAAQITSKTPSKLTVVVPAGATGACTIEVDSPAGTFQAKGTLAVP